MIKRFKAWRLWRRFDHAKGPLRSNRRPRRSPGEHVQRRRRSFRVFVVLLVSLVGALYILYASDGTPAGWNLFRGEQPQEEEVVQDDSEIPGGEPSSEPVPEQSEASPAAVAYQAVAPELPGLDPGSVQGVYQSKLDSSWASVRIVAPSEDEGPYVVFLQREGDSWEARRSIRADEPEHPEYERAVLDEVPEDLVKSLYPQSLASAADPSGLLMEPVETGTLPSVEVAEVPPAESVTDEVPEAEREQVDEGLEEARQAIEDYGTEHEGTAGVYVQDLKGGWGYGVNPDEAFFGASIMKVPIMVAVYRKMDEDEFSLRDMFETRPEDWAGGAGWLQWEEAGTDHTVEDYLWMMMTQSDNTATNALMRIVGGPEHVNEVARSMGAPGMVLYQKVTSERAAVPALDNRTTPRDMSTILGKIAAGQAANPESCQKMVELMHQNHLLSPLKAGLPDGVEVAYKGGWLYKVYDETGLVWHGDHPYVVSIFSKHGSEDPEDGKALLKDISEGVYKAQSDLDD